MSEYIVKTYQSVSDGDKKEFLKRATYISIPFTEYNRVAKVLGISASTLYKRCLAFAKTVKAAEAQVGKPYLLARLQLTSTMLAYAESLGR